MTIKKPNDWAIIRKRTDVPATAKLVWRTLERMIRAYGKAKVSMRWIAEDIGESEAAVKRSISKLTKLGLVSRSGFVNGTRCTYKLTTLSPTNLGQNDLGTKVKMTQKQCQNDLPTQVKMTYPLGQNDTGPRSFCTNVPELGSNKVSTLGGGPDVAAPTQTPESPKTETVQEDFISFVDDELGKLFGAWRGEMRYSAGLDFFYLGELVSRFGRDAVVKALRSVMDKQDVRKWQPYLEAVLNRSSREQTAEARRQPRKPAKDKEAEAAYAQVKARIEREREFGRR